MNQKIILQIELLLFSKRMWHTIETYEMTCRPKSWHVPQQSQIPDWHHRQHFTRSRMEPLVSTNFTGQLNLIMKPIHLANRCKPCQMQVLREKNCVTGTYRNEIGLTEHNYAWRMNNNLIRHGSGQSSCLIRRVSKNCAFILVII